MDFVPEGAARFGINAGGWLIKQQQSRFVQHAGGKGEALLPAAGKGASQLMLAAGKVEAFEGPILLSECMQAKGEDDCPFRTNCPVRSKWGRVQVAMLREMASITFEDLVQEAVGIPMLMPSFV